MGGAVLATVGVGLGAVVSKVWALCLLVGVIGGTVGYNFSYYYVCACVWCVRGSVCVCSCACVKEIES